MNVELEYNLKSGQVAARIRRFKYNQDYYLRMSHEAVDDDGKKKTQQDMLFHYGNNGEGCSSAIVKPEHAPYTVEAVTVATDPQGVVYDSAIVTKEQIEGLLPPPVVKEPLDY